MEEYEPWRVGQTAVISRNQVVTIERVTPLGRAVVDGRTFDRDGYERTKGNRWRRAKLELLTVEVQAEMDLVRRARDALNESNTLMDRAEKRLGGVFSAFLRDVPEVADVEWAERLVAVLKPIME